MSSFGSRFKEIRTNFDITQEQLGNMLGVSYVYISKIENQGRIPSKTIINFYCQLFFIRKEWLLKGEYPIHETPENIVNDLAQLDRHTVTEVATRLYRKIFMSAVATDEAVSRNENLALMFNYLETLWNSSPDMQGWIKVQFKEAFPKFEEWQKEQLEIEKKGKVTKQ
jgi:transcriptional regulator with XRE-family HTH domain